MTKKKTSAPKKRSRLSSHRHTPWPRPLRGSSPAVVRLYRRRTPLRHLPGDTPTSGSLPELRSLHRLPPAHRHTLPTSSSPAVDVDRPDEHAPRDPRCGQRTVRGTLGLICLALVLATPTAPTMSCYCIGRQCSTGSRHAPNEFEVESVTVEIRWRMFIPNHVLLHHDRKTVLRFRNHDTELHTVVAKELFFGVDLNVGGNGAPEFGPDGLKRVIIPPEGLT